MKITGYLKTKEKIEVNLHKLECIYWSEGKYFFIYQEEAVIIEEDINDNLLQQYFLFIPGRRLVKDATLTITSPDAIVFENDHIYYKTDVTKHFINRNNINWFISSKHNSGLNLYKIGIDKFIGNVRMNEDFYFLISSANITSQMIHYFE